MTSLTYTQAQLDILLSGKATPAQITAAVAALTKSSVGLANVDNTADSAKPVSTAQAAAITAAINGLVNGAPGALDTLNELGAALGNDANFGTTITNALALKAPLASPTFTGTVSGVTKTHVGLGNVDNTADTAKPVSTAQTATFRPNLTTLATATTSVAPTVGAIQPYSLGGGSFAPVLPALSGLATGSTYVGIQKAVSDTSTNTATITCAGSDTFDSTATSISLVAPGELRILQVVTIGGTKYWKVVGGNTPISALDTRFVKQSDLDSTAIQASDVQYDGTTTVAQRIASLLARVTVLESLALIASTAPAITGTATVGQTLTVTPGAFSNSPTSRTYQWNRAGAAISGATGATYTLVSADAANQITVTETPVRTGYTGYPSTSAAVTVAAPTAPVTDNFTSATINGTNWPLSSGTTIVGGRARIPATTAYPGLTSGDVFDLSQYPLYVQIPTATNAGNGSVQTIFSLSDSTYANKIFFNINGSPRLVWMHGLGTTPTNVSGSQTITYDPAVHVWFRFRISGANLLFETSPDGTTWTVQRTVVTPAWITSGLRRVILQAVYTGTEPTPGYAEFDNFNTLS